MYKSSLSWLSIVFFQSQWIMSIFNLFLVPWSVQNWITAYWNIPSQCLRKVRQLDRTKDDWWCLKHSISTFHFWIAGCVASSSLLLFGCVMRPILAGYLITHSHSGRSCDFHCTPGEFAVSDMWSWRNGAITCNFEILHFTMLISKGLLDGKDDTCILFSSLASKY